MKELLSLLTCLLTATVASTALAQPQINSHGFTDAGTFRLTVGNGADIEVSHDLQSWSKFASVTQPAGLDDLGSRAADRRFYRVHGGSNVVGYVKVVIPPGKLAILGDSFATAIHLETPEARHAVFGITNPPVKISLYTNGNFVAHSLDPATGAWTPPLRPIRSQEGFSVQNVGTSPLTVRMSGNVHQGRIHTTIPAGHSLVVSPFPATSATTELASIPAQDGTQVNWFDEQTQNYQTSTFDTLEKPGKWVPPLPNLQPGRAVVIKAPQAMTITNSLPAAAIR